MNTLHRESWKYSTRTVQSRRIKLCFTYNRLHTVSIYHVEAIRKWSYVNSKYCSHHQWKSVDYFLSFIAMSKWEALLLPNLSSFGFVCKRYCKLQYIEIMVEKKVRVDGSEIVVPRLRRFDIRMTHGHWVNAMLLSSWHPEHGRVDSTIYLLLLLQYTTEGLSKGHWLYHQHPWRQV